MTINHHIQKAAELNALQCAEMNEGREDMKKVKEIAESLL